MGSGTWSTDTYEDLKRARARKGIADFDYNDKTTSLPRHMWKAHKTLNPLNVKMRESRDSEEHPNSTAVAVEFDATGSMGEIPVVLQKKLPQLFSLLLRNAYVPDPQILIGAIGDATCDQVPLQVGQFESDIRIDEQLRNLLLEGGGGGHITESYELALYFMDRHTDIDCFNKRGRKGYLFTIGDETPYAYVNKEQVRELIGDKLQSDIPVEEVVKSLKRRYHVFHIIPEGASHGGESIIFKTWQKLLGQNVIRLSDPNLVCETIGATIGLTEGSVSLDTAITDLKALGTGDKAANSISKALATVPTGTSVVSSFGKLFNKGVSRNKRL